MKEQFDSTTLAFSINNLEGSIPSKFDVSTSLQTFEVGYNQLTEKLPRPLVKCLFVKQQKLMIQFL